MQHSWLCLEFPEKNQAMQLGVFLYFRRVFRYNSALLLVVFPENNRWYLEVRRFHFQHLSQNRRTTLLMMFEWHTAPAFLVGMGVQIKGSVTFKYEKKKMEVIIQLVCPLVYQNVLLSPPWIYSTCKHHRWRHLYPHWSAFFWIRLALITHFSTDRYSARFRGESSSNCCDELSISSG